MSLANPRFRLVPALALLGLLGVPALAARPAAAEEVTASWTSTEFPNSYGSFGNTTSVTGRGLLFEAAISGVPASATIRCGRNSDHEVPLRAEIFATDAGTGLPTGEPLASAEIPAAQFAVQGAGTEVTFAFSARTAPLEAGKRYALVFAPVSQGEASLYFLLGEAGDAAPYPFDTLYAFGSPPSWTATDVTDYPFTVTVADGTPVETRSWGGLKRLPELPARPAAR